MTTQGLESVAAGDTVICVNSRVLFTAAPPVDHAPVLAAALRQCRSELRRNLQRERSEVSRTCLKTAFDAAGDALDTYNAATVTGAAK